jgi:hypothetical protein
MLPYIYNEMITRELERMEIDCSLIVGCSESKIVCEKKK